MPILIFCHFANFGNQSLVPDFCLKSCSAATCLFFREISAHADLLPKTSEISSKLTILKVFYSNLFRKRSSSKDKSRRGEKRGEHRSRRDRNSKKNNEEKLGVCKQFMLGKCPKSPERCPFSHDCDPPKIMELCKFYLLERCAKKEKCLYLHKGFPCKYFHTGHR